MAPPERRILRAIRSAVQTLILGWVICVFSCCSRPVQIQPAKDVLKISPDHVSLGRLADGASKHASYKVLNTSSSPIQIQKISVSCGCTSAWMDTLLLAPGQATKLHVQMTNRGTFGPIAGRSILLYEMAGKSTATKEVKVDAVSEQLALLEPGYIDFGKVVSDGPDAHAEVVVHRGNASAAWSTLDLGEHSAGLAMRFEPAPQDTYKLVAALATKDLPLGHYTGSLKVRFLADGGTELGQRSLTVRAEVTGPVEVKPATIYLGVIKAAQAQNGRLKILGTGGKPVHLEKIQEIPDDGRLTFDQSVQGADSISVPYQFHPPVTGGEASSVLRLTVSVGSRSFVVDVPVLCYVTP